MTETMLKKYEETQEAIKTQETQVEEESASIGNLLTEKSSKQQEVQNLVASTSDNINSYVNQIKCKSGRSRCSYDSGEQCRQ